MKTTEGLNQAREQNFRNKLDSAARELIAEDIREVESLKFRSAPSYHNYPDLLSQMGIHLIK